MRNFALTILLLLVGGLSQSCSSPLSTTLLVLFQVNNLTTNIKSIGVTLRLDGKLSNEGDFVISDNLENFGVRIDKGTEGMLSTVVGARDSQGNVLRKGDASVTIPTDADSINVTIDLNDLHPCSTSDMWCPYGMNPTSASLRSIWGADRADIWVAGLTGTLIHWNGQYWETLEVPADHAAAQLTAIWGSSSSDVYIASDSNLTLHWDGSSKTFTSINTGQLTALGGTGSSDIWGIGINSLITHWDGINWKPIQLSNATNQLNALWVSGPNEAWVVGNSNTGDGVIFHCTGSACNDLTPPAQKLSLPSLHGVWGSSSGGIWIAGSSSAGVGGFWNSTDNGMSWLSFPVTDGTSIQGIWGSAADDIWAVGGLLSTPSTGKTMHWDGKSWWDTPSDPASFLYGIWGSAPEGPTTAGAVWTAGDNGTILQWQDNHWLADSGNSPPVLSLTDVWGNNADDIWAVGGNGMLHWNGTNWATFPTQGSFTSIWGSDPTHIWTVGSNGSIQSWSHSAWVNSPSGINYNLSSISGTTSDNVWIAGYGGTILRLDTSTLPSNWTSVSSTTTKNLYSIWVNSMNEIWAGGLSGTLVMCNGIMSPPLCMDKTGMAGFNGKSIRSIWGKPNDIWIAGDSGLIRRCNPLCTTIPTPSTTTNITHIWGTTVTDVWAVGDDGSIWHYAGTGAGFGAMDSNTRQALNSIWGGNPADIWAVGSGGTILRRQLSPSGT